jgi:hypothetical protein
MESFISCEITTHGFKRILHVSKIFQLVMKYFIEKVNQRTMEVKNKRKKTVKNFDELIESRHGKIGTKKRTEFEIKATSFAMGNLIKEERVHGISMTSTTKEVVNPR